MAEIRLARRRALLLLGLGPAGLVAACGRRGPAHEPPPADVAAVVTMGVMSFDPEEVHIRAGESVFWRNGSLFTHTVTCDPERAEVELPEGASPFHSGSIPPGEVFRHSFEVPGSYRYVCLPHQEFGMGGRIVVDAPPVG